MAAIQAIIRAHEMEAGFDVEDDEGDDGEDGNGARPAASSRRRQMGSMSRRHSRSADGRKRRGDETALPAARAGYDFEQDAAATGGDVGLVQCGCCGRYFAEDRIEAHERACEKQAEAKPRRTFDTAKARRAEGAEEFAGLPDADAGRARKPASTWANESKNLREVMKYNRKLAKAQAAGIDIATLGPPPKQAHDVRTQCPHCGRKFNADVAERHIPKCNENPNKR